MKKLIMALTLTTTLGGLNAFSNPETDQATSNIGATDYVEVEFQQDKAVLSEEEKAELKQLVDETRQNTKIDEIKVLAWSDREYPAEGQKASQGDIRLAKIRAENIRNYIKKDLNVKKVKVYNMAERPNQLNEILKTSDFKVKKVMENTGVAPTSEAETGILGTKSKAALALVMIVPEKK